MRMQVTKNRLLPLLLLTPLISTANLPAQPQDAASPRALTASDYARAEKFLGYNTNPLVYHAVRPKWTPDERLWYRDTDAVGARFVIFDPVKLTKEPAFDHAKLAAALSTTSGKTYEANNGHFGGNAALSVYQFRKRVARDAKGVGSIGNCQAQRLDALAQNNASGVWWIFHGHGPVPFSGNRHNQHPPPRRQNGKSPASWRVQ